MEKPDYRMTKKCSSCNSEPYFRWLTTEENKERWRFMCMGCKKSDHQYYNSKQEAREAWEALQSAPSA